MNRWPRRDKGYDMILRVFLPGVDRHLVSLHGAGSVVDFLGYAQRLYIERSPGARVVPAFHRIGTGAGGQTRTGSFQKPGSNGSPANLTPSRSPKGTLVIPFLPTNRPRALLSPGGPAATLDVHGALDTVSFPQNLRSTKVESGAYICSLPLRHPNRQRQRRDITGRQTSRAADKLNGGRVCRATALLDATIEIPVSFTQQRRARLSLSARLSLNVGLHAFPAPVTTVVVRRSASSASDRARADFGPRILRATIDSPF